jgi:hypothetical protein
VKIKFELCHDGLHEKHDKPEEAHNALGSKFSSIAKSRDQLQIQVTIGKKNLRFLHENN